MVKYCTILMLVDILISCGTVTGGGTSLSQSTADAPPQSTDVTAPQSTREAGMTQAQVTLQMFSGREPPTWSLTASDTKTLTDLITGLSPGNQPLPEGQLGYQGFVVKLSDASSPVSGTVTVYRDIVRRDTGSTTKLLSDPDRRVEQFLVASAKAGLSADLYKTLQEQVGTAP